MPRLKDVLDALMADFYAARAASDMRAAELHQLYASDETLSQFSIPSFQFGGVELDVPVVLTGIEGEAQPTPTQPKTPTRSAVASTSLATLKPLAKERLKITVSKAEEKAFIQYVDDYIDADALSTQNMGTISQQLVEIFQAVINERKTKYPNERYEDWDAMLAKQLETEFLTPPPTKTEMAYLGTTVALAMGGDAEKSANDNGAKVTHLRLKIEEHAFRVEKVPTQVEGEFRKVVVRE